MAKKKKVVKKIKLTVMAAKYWRILINSPDKYYNAPMLPMPNIVIHRQPKMDVTKPLMDGERYPLAQVDTRWVEDSAFGLFDPCSIELHIYPKMFIRYFHHYYGGMHLPYEAAAVYVTKVLIHEFCHHIRNMHMWKQCVPIPKKELIRDFKKSCEKMSLYLDKAGYDLPGHESGHLVKELLKVLKAMTQGQKADLLDVTCRQTVHLDEYDCIGFASGIYGFTVQKAVAEFTRQYLPENKDKK